MRNILSLAVLSFTCVLCQDAAVRAQSAAPVPEIIFSESPALLIRIDGDPVYRRVDGTALQRVVNTKALILRDDMDTHYLKILDGWMEAYSFDGWWSVAGAPPAGARVAVRRAVEAKGVDLLLTGGQPQTQSGKPSLANRQAPTIYISTTPAALIVTDGPARFATVGGTSLEYIENTTARVFREPTDQELYVLIAGRWFRSWTTDGPWQVVPGDDLPADFAKIPDK
jgi:hypothetical protein